MSFWLSSHRFLSLNRALWEIPPPAMWPLCPHSYRTRRTVWSTVPLTREEAKREVKPRAPGAGYFHRTRRDGSLLQLKKKKDQKNRNGLYIYRREDPAGLFPYHPCLTWTGDDGGHSGTPHTKVGSDQCTMRITTWAWWDTGHSRPVWSRKDRRQSV